MNPYKFNDLRDVEIPDKISIGFYKDMIITEAKDRIYQLLDDGRKEDAQAFAKEWTV